MTEKITHDEGEDVEAHLLKETLAVGTAAAAMFAGSAQGAVQADPGGSPSAKAASVEPGARARPRQVEPGPGGTQAAAPQQREVGPGGTAQAKPKAKKRHAKPSARRH
ncbi:MAG: hypothetical protein ABR583_09430 [Gaiellaceae bacterium]